MSPRNTHATATAICFSFWLVFDKDGSMRMTRTEPSLDRAERSMFLSVTLPKTLWQTPSLRGHITVPGDAAAPEFTLDVATVGEALRQALGVDIDLKVHTPPTD